MMLTVAIALTLCVSTPAVPPEKETGIREAVDVILNAQLPDGALLYDRAKNEVIPYYSHFIAWGLIEAASVLDDDSRCFEAVTKWLHWCETHRDENGCVMDYDLRDGRLVSRGDADSTDAYAALEMLTVERLHLAGRSAGVLTKERLESCLNAIELTYDGERELTYAKPGWPVQYLMDNVEVWRGLIAATFLARELEEKELASRAQRLRCSIEKGLRRFWNPEREYFAWAISKDGKASIALEVAYPDALAQVLLLVYALDPDALGDYRESLNRALEIMQKEIETTRRTQPTSIKPLHWAYWSGLAYSLLGRTREAVDCERRLEDSPAANALVASFYIQIALRDEKSVRPKFSRIPISLLAQSIAE